MSWLDSLEEIRKRDWSEATGPERIAKAREVINISAYAAAAASVVPIPLSDLVLLVPVHTAMVMTVGHVFGRALSRAEAKRVALELAAVGGMTYAGGAAINAVRKLLMPAIGGLFSVPATFALTWGLGRVSIAYFENPSLSRDDLKKVFDEAVKEGKGAFSKDFFEGFRQKNAGVEVVDVESVKGEATSPDGKGSPEATPADTAQSAPKSHPGGEPPPSSAPRPKKRTL